MHGTVGRAKIIYREQEGCNRELGAQLTLKHRKDTEIWILPNLPAWLFLDSFKMLCQKLLLFQHYRKTPLISTYVFSGLATEQVLIFGAVLTFGGGGGVW